MNIIDSLIAKKIVGGGGGGGGSVPEYEGSYTVTPSESAQTLATDGKKCTDDITVNPISSTYIGSGITQKAAATYTPTTSDQTIAANQYLSGAQTVKGDANLVSGNIKKDTQIFGVTGTYEGSGGGDWVEPSEYDSNSIYVYVDIPYDNCALSLLLHRNNPGNGSVFWGDGSSNNLPTDSTNTTHQYEKTGKYVVQIKSTSGLYPSGGTSANKSIFGAVNNCGLYIKKIRFPEEGPIAGYINFVGSYWFYSCLALDEVYNLNEYGSYEFAYTSLRSAVIIYNQNNSLRDTIKASCFQSCYNLRYISIPPEITTIEASAFAYNNNAEEIHFLGSTPPTVANSNAWTNLPTTCKIYVPTGSLSAYTSATNYPSSATYTYVEE